MGTVAMTVRMLVAPLMRFPKMALGERLGSFLGMLDARGAGSRVRVCSSGLRKAI